MITDDMLHTVLRRRAGGEPVEDIRPDRYPDRQARRENPSLASIYRAPAEHEKRQAQAQAERAAARAELDNAPSPGAFTDADVYARLDSMTEDVAEVLTGKRPEKLIEFYDDLELNLLYDNKKEAVDVTASVRVNSECVRGGTWTRTAGRFPWIGEIIPETLLHVPARFRSGMACIGIPVALTTCIHCGVGRGLCLPAWLAYSYL